MLRADGPTEGSMRFSIFQDTALGGRSTNQDRMGYCFTRDALFMILADGMGGHMRGEVAAQIALQSTAALFQTRARPALPDPVEFLDSALRHAHHEILRYQQLQQMPEAPRTTVVACVVQAGTAWWAHAGDSRFYLLRGGGVLSRTRDHSKVQTMVALGLLQPGEEETHPERNKVLNCLGSPFEPTVEIGQATKLQAGDRLLLCSDGLWSAMNEEELSRSLLAGPISQTIPDMVRRAVASMGRAADNTTAVALAWEGESEEATDGDSVSSATLPEGAFTSTITPGVVADEPSKEMSEDEIERTIREIRTAIGKTQAK